MDKKVGCWVWPVIVMGGLLCVWGFCIGSLSVIGQIWGTSGTGQNIGGFLIGLSFTVLLPLVIGLGMLGFGIYTLRKSKQPSSLQSAFGTIGSSGSTSNEENKIERRCSVCNRTNTDYLRDLKRKDPNVYIISYNFIGICPICEKAYCVEHAAYDNSIDHEVCPIHKEKLV
jgi:hypothetical protein